MYSENDFSNLSFFKRALIFIRSFIFQTTLYVFASCFLTIACPFLWIFRNSGHVVLCYLVNTAFFMSKHLLRIHMKGENLEIFKETLEKHGPFIIACKHQSGLETVYFFPYFSKLKVHLTAVVKGDLTKVPIVKTYVRKMRFAKVEKSSGHSSINGLIEKATESMQIGRPLLIFPEGSRMKFGTVGKYHSGVGVLYKKLNVPIVPVAHNAGAIWQKKSLIKFPGTITFRVLEPIMPGLDIKELLEVLEKRVETECQKLGSGRKF